MPPTYTSTSTLNPTDICSENGLPRTGAKYKLKADLIEHAKQVGFDSTTSSIECPRGT